MTDKLLILEDTERRRPRRRVQDVRRRSAQPDRLRVLERRRDRREGAGVAVLQGHRRRRQVRRSRDASFTASTRPTRITRRTASRFDPGGSVYFQEGTFHHTQVESPWGPARRVQQRRGVSLRAANAEVRRLRVASASPIRTATRSIAGARTSSIDGTGAVPYHAALFSGHIEFPAKHTRPPTVYQQRTRPCPGLEILSQQPLPRRVSAELAGAERDRLPRHSAIQTATTTARAYGADELEPIVFSSDPNFRPTDVEIAPDGSMYFVDWQNPIIGHLQHNLRDPNRDKTHGRIYRVTYEGRPLLEAEEGRRRRRSTNSSRCSPIRRTASACVPRPS